MLPRRERQSRGLVISAIRGFNPRSHAGSDWSVLQYQIFHHVVSIHAPYAGSDFTLFYCLFWHGSFNPRPLCRERQNPVEHPALCILFQSTPPMQGATVISVYCDRFPVFQSTPPMQGATKFREQMYETLSVSIHAPYAGSDLFLFCYCPW